MRACFDTTFAPHCKILERFISGKKVFCQIMFLQNVAERFFAWREARSRYSPVVGKICVPPSAGGVARGPGASMSSFLPCMTLLRFSPTSEIQNHGILESTI